MKTARASVEPLESRIAPALLFPNASTATYTDLDGDFVKVVLSKPIIQEVFAASTRFSQGNLGGEKITTLNLSMANAAGVNVTITATPKDVTGDGLADGDGLVNIGYLNATGRNLGTVSIAGDLTKINVGTGLANAVALASLTVQSMNSVGLEAGATDYFCLLKGAVGSIKTKGDLGSTLVIEGKLGALTIDGDLNGSAGLNAGYLSVNGDLTTVKIGGNIRGGAVNSASLNSGGKITSLTVGGDVFGGESHTANIRAAILGTVAITGDVRGTALETATIVSSTIIGSVTIGGSLVGGDATSAFIKSGGDMGAVKIGHDIQGGYDTAKTKEGSARIYTGGKLTSVTVGGSLLGGSGESSGSIESFGNMGAVTVTGSMRGGSGIKSAHIYATGDLASLNVRGSIQGGEGDNSGYAASGRKLATVTIGHDLHGDVGDSSGTIYSSVRIDSVSIGGSILGGAGDYSGRVASSSIGRVAVTGDVHGHTGSSSGIVHAVNELTSITIGGSLIGGIDPDPSDNDFLAFGSGSIEATRLPSVTIGHDIVGHGYSRAIDGDVLGRIAIGGSLIGGEEFASGSIAADVSLDSLTIGGDVRGGSGEGSGKIGGAKLGAITIGGSLIGGLAMHTGEIVATGTLGAVKIGGDVTADNLLFHLNDYAYCGFISGALGITSVSIGGSLIGSDASHTGAIVTSGSLGAVTIGGNIVGGSTEGNVRTDTGTILAQRIASVTVRGSIISGVFETINGSGSLTHSGSVQAAQDIGAIFVKGSLVGNSTFPVIISAAGQPNPTATTDLAIKSLTVSHNVEFALVAAGYSQLLRGVNADAQIGAVLVSGDWKASTLIAGLDPKTGGFGNGDDAKLPKGGEFGSGPVRDEAPISKIASVVIAGRVVGLPGTPNLYGFGAEEIGSFRYNGIGVMLKAGAHNDIFSTTPALHRARPLGPSLSGGNADGFAVHVFEV
jgi:hypothetical protein